MLNVRRNCQKSEVLKLIKKRAPEVSSSGARFGLLRLTIILDENTIGKSWHRAQNPRICPAFLILYLAYIVLC